MRVEKIDHVGILVGDLTKAETFFSELLESRFTGGVTEHLKDEDSDGKSIMNSLGIELTTPTVPDGPMAKTLKRQGEGFLYLSFKVANLDEAMAEMEAKGVRKTYQVEFPGHGKLRAAFFHPKDTFGVMIELIEYETEHPALTAVKK